MLDFKKIKINPVEQPQTELTGDFVQDGGDFQTEQNQNLSSEPSSTISTEPEPTHFDSLINSSPMDADGMGNALVLKPDEFHKMFCFAFNMGSTISGLQSLAVDDKDGAALACSSSLYEMCLEIPALHFLVSPQGKWGTRIIGIGAFAVPMALAVAKEARERQPAAQDIAGTSQSNAVNVADLQF